MRKEKKKRKFSN